MSINTFPFKLATGLETSVLLFLSFRLLHLTKWTGIVFEGLAELFRNWNKPARFSLESVKYNLDRLKTKYLKLCVLLLHWKLSYKTLVLVSGTKPCEARDTQL